MIKEIPRITDYDKVLPVAEVYTAVQSEGSRAGYPTVIVRTTGCTHRCFFGEGGWCDSWYTSIHPEKGSFTFNDIIKVYDENPHITEMMITGGSPTMHPSLLQELTDFATERGIYTTMETEGSVHVKLKNPINLISLSPKFSNSVPKLGVSTPLGAATTQRMIDQHNKFRNNKATITDIIVYQTVLGQDYHVKPVWDGEDMEVLKEILETVKNLPEEKVWFMPAGDTREALFKSYAKLFDWVRDNGYRLTWRPHIIAFADARCV